MPGEGVTWREPLLERPRRTLSEELIDMEEAEEQKLQHARANIKGVALFAMAYRSVGIIFGDLGTSPLYVLHSTFDHPPSKPDAMGVLSLIIWTITLLGLVKYVGIVLWANDNGEGGTISLYSLLCRSAKIGFEYRTHTSDLNLSRISTMGPLSSSRGIHVHSKLKALLEHSSHLKRLLFVMVLMGTSMVIGDGILTPAISVLSAVEGLRVAIPSMDQNVVVAISVGILVGLFTAQRFGTNAVGGAFAPILLTWLFSIAGIGIYNAATYHPTVFAAISPIYAADFFIRNGWDAWRMLGGILLCVTGTEAMFADLGHFNIAAIQTSFTGVAYPCVLLQYFGQVAFIIEHPEDVVNAFWAAVPQPIFWPMFVIGTLAAIVASQALITGVFSIINQLMSLNCVPPLKVVHTSPDHHGQIFIPEVNYFIMLLTISVVLGFKDSVHLGNAYGVAVTVDMLTTTMLVSMVMILVWDSHLLVALLFFLFFGTIELAFFSATLLKVPHGGWFPIAIAVLLTSIMYVWNWGSRLKSVHINNKQVAPELFFAAGEESLRLQWSDTPIARVPGIGFYFSDASSGLPPVLQHFVRNVPALHDVLVIVNVRNVPVSTVLPEERLLVSQVPQFSGFYRIVCRFGYNDIQDLGDAFANEVIRRIFHMFQVGEVVQERLLRSYSSKPSEDGSVRRISPPVRISSTSSSTAEANGDTFNSRDTVELDHDFRRATSKDSGPRANSPLVQGIVGAHLQRMSASAAQHSPSHRLRDESLSRKSASPVLALGLQRSSLRAAFSESLHSPRLRRHSWQQQFHSTSPQSPLDPPPTVFAVEEQVEHAMAPEASGSEGLPADAARIHHAKMQGVVYIVGRSIVRARHNSSWLRRLLLEQLYVYMNINFRGWALAQRIPQNRLIEVGMALEL